MTYLLMYELRNRSMIHFFTDLVSRDWDFSTCENLFKLHFGV